MQVQHDYHNEFIRYTFPAYHIPCEIQSVAIVASLTVWVIMGVVAMVATIVLVVVVVEVLVSDAAMMDMVIEVLTIGVLAGVEIILVCVVVNVFKFAVAVSYSADVPSDVATDLFMGALMLGALIGIEIEVLLTDANANAFAVVMSTSLEEFSRCAAFDCRPLDLLDCVRVLHTWRPSYQV